MKKLFLILVAAVSFNANAVFISLTTDKDTYNVGDVVTVTATADDLSTNGSQYYFSGYLVAFTWNTSVLELVNNSLQSLMPYGPKLAPLFPSIPSGSFLPGALIANPFDEAELFSNLSQIANVLKINSTLQNADPFTQSGSDEVGLFSVQFIAKELGENISFTGVGDSQLSDLIGVTENVRLQSASFSVAEVPAPSTLLLSLLALAGVAVARSRKQA